MIDLTATARVEDYDITLSLHGTPEKLSVTYRSDPPLPEADVVALLALGRTGNQQRLYTQQQEAAGTSPATDALLGGALNATVSSRVQRLFGAGSVKVDPNYLGALGNSTSRIIVEEQLGTKRNPHLRHQRQHDRAAVDPGRCRRQPPYHLAVGARRVRCLLRGFQSHPTLQITVYDGGKTGEIA